jgi:hypothetical protein
MENSLTMKSRPVTTEILALVFSAHGGAELGCDGRHLYPSYWSELEPECGGRANYASRSAKHRGVFLC